MKYKLLTIVLLPLIVSAQNIEVAFSPGMDALNLILKTINSAQKTICLAAYSFTSKEITYALIKARERKVEIKIIADEKANRAKYSAVHYLANHGIDVRLNNSYKIMHNKFIVVDNKTVESGSFNYSQAAYKSNAENVIVLWDNRLVASKYAAQCDKLYNQGYILNKKY